MLRRRQFTFPDLPYQSPVTRPKVAGFANQSSMREIALICEEQSRVRCFSLSNLYTKNTLTKYLIQKYLNKIPYIVSG